MPITSKKYDRLAQEFSDANSLYNQLLEQADGEETDEVKEARNNFYKLREELDAEQEALRQKLIDENQDTETEQEPEPEQSEEA